MLIEDSDVLSMSQMHGSYISDRSTAFETEKKKRKRKCYKTKFIFAL